MENAMIAMKKGIMDYKAIIFDVDGTLYYQGALRRRMALRLLLYYGRHPWQVQDINILRNYRKLRERWQAKSGGEMSMEEEQYHALALSMKVSYARVVRCVNHWIHTEPIPLVKICADKQIGRIFSWLQEQGIKTAIYSDYSVADKLRALDISTEYNYSSADAEINCMKPDPFAVEVILKNLELSADQVLMIGDRYEKDGLSAKNSGMDYVILPKSMPARCALYKKLFDIIP